MKLRIIYKITAIVGLGALALGGGASSATATQHSFTHEASDSSPGTEVLNAVSEEEVEGETFEQPIDEAEADNTAGVGETMPVDSAPSALPQVVLPSGTHRASGLTRYDTSAAISAFAYPNGVDTLVLASGEGFPDALSAAPLAAKLRAPLLLTTPRAIPAAIQLEIDRLNPSNVIIVGGPAVVSAGIEERLSRSVATVTRVSGVTRYQTSALVARYGWLGGASDAFIATGIGFADALAAAPAASRLGGPVVLVPPSNNAELEEPKRVLATLGVQHLHIAGGTAVVPTVVQNVLAQGERDVRRYAGHDKFDTAASILAAFFSDGSEPLFWANGDSFPDALSGAALAGASGAALALSQKECVPPVIRAETSTIEATTVLALGGLAVVSDNVRDGFSCFTKVPVPVLSGRAKVGLTLTFNPGTWQPQPAEFSYQWRRNGVNIPGATGLSYTVAPADLGTQVSIEVTGKLDGYAESARASAPSIVVFDDRTIDSASSLNVVVNKRRPLSPRGYVPSDLRYPAGILNVNGQPLRGEAATALELMNASARSAGITLTLQSGYRSYDLQNSIYNGYVAREGRASADTHSARPGYSEHQTGLAVDLNDGGGCALRECFADTAAGHWLKANAHMFGFIPRYDSGLQPVVGFMYEPWHYRFVGVKVARDMKSKKIRTLEEYYGLGSAPSY